MHVSLWDAAGKTNLFHDEPASSGCRRSPTSSWAACCSTPSAVRAHQPDRQLLQAHQRAAHRVRRHLGAQRHHLRRQQPDPLIRIPAAGRLELRLLDGAANPYLLQAALLAAGLDGIAAQARPRPPPRHPHVRGRPQPPAGHRAGCRTNLLDAVRALGPAPSAARRTRAPPSSDAYVKLKTDGVGRLSRGAFRVEEADDDAGLLGRRGRPCAPVLRRRKKYLVLVTPFAGRLRSSSCKGPGGAHDDGGKNEDVPAAADGSGDGGLGDRICRRGDGAQAAADLVDLQVMDRETGQPLRVWRHRGRLFVAGQPGARYSLRVTNNTGGRVLVVMSVDGVNILTGETAGYGQRGYVFGPYRVLRRQRLAQVRHRGRGVHLRAASAILRRPHRAGPSTSG